MPEDPEAVTSALYQDPVLSRIYANLPFLKYVFPSVCYESSLTPPAAPEKSVRFFHMPRPVARHQRTQHQSVLYSQILPQRSTHLRQSKSAHFYALYLPQFNISFISTLLKAMLFTQSRVHINLSRIHPNLLQQDSGRLRMKRPDNAAAVPLYIGVCTKGMISDVDLVGPRSSLNAVHGMTIAGSVQETRRYTALLGESFGYDSITGHMTKLGLSFYTRGQGKDGNFGPPPGERHDLLLCLRRLFDLRPQLLLPPAPPIECLPFCPAWHCLRPSALHKGIRCPVPLTTVVCDSNPLQRLYPC